MEGLEWLFSLGTGGGFVALLWVTLRFFGSSQKDATDAAMAMYQAVNTRCVKCETERDEAKAERDVARAEVNALRHRILGLERQLEQMGESANHAIKKLRDE